MKGRSLVVTLIVLGLAAGYLAWRVKGRAKPGQVASAQADLDAVGAALARLPADAWAVAAIPRLEDYRRDFDASELGKLAGDPGFLRDLRAALETAGEEAPATTLLGIAENLAELRSLGLRSIALAVYPLPASEGSRPGLGIVAAADDAHQAAAWFDRRVAEAEAASPAPAPEIGGALGATGYKCRGDLCRATAGQELYIASPLEALERLLPDATGAGQRPGEDPRLRRAIEATRATPAGFFAFVDLQRTGAALRALLAEDPDLARLGAALRLEAFDSLAFAESADGALYHSSLRLSWDAAAVGPWAPLLSPPPRELIFDRLLPAGFDMALFGSTPDLVQAWDAILAALGEAASPEQKLGIGAVAGALNGMLGVDLRNDLLAVFSGEWGLAWQGVASGAAEGKKPLTRLDGQRVVFAASVADELRAERLLDGLDAALKKRGVPVVVEAVGQGKMWTATLSDKPDERPVVALIEGKLLFATHSKDLREILLAKSKPLSGDTAYQTLRARLGAASALVVHGRPGSGKLAALRPRLDGLPPSVAVVRTSAGLLEVEAITPFNTGLGGAILGLLAAPQVAESVRRREVARTEQALVGIGLACEAWALDHDAPPTAASVAELKTLVEPTYARDLPLTDAWGFAIAFRSDGAAYVVASPGSDGQFEEDWTAACLQGCDDRAGSTTRGEEDLVFVRGRAIRGPSAGPDPAGAP